MSNTNGQSTEGQQPQEQEEQSFLLDKEWETQQIKSFTVWANTYLKKVGSHIEDISNDFKDGKKLIELLEVISKERLERPEKKNYRVHHILNINKCFNFIKSKGVKLSGIGAEEIVDGNIKMTLGMIWTLILRFSITVEVEGKSKRDGLLLWVQSKVKGYPNVKVNDFSSSFKNGLAFCALISAYDKNLLDFSSLKKENAAHNLTLAFDLAEKYLDVPKMLEVESTKNMPDEKSVMTCISFYYTAFLNLKKFESSYKSINKSIDKTMGAKTKIIEYESNSSKLNNWINEKTNELGTQYIETFNVEEIRDCIKKNDEFRNCEKSKMFDLKVKLENDYNDIKIQMFVLNLPEYVPIDTCKIDFINSNWSEMEKKENDLRKNLNENLQKALTVESLKTKLHFACEQNEIWIASRLELLDVEIDKLTLGQVQSEHLKISKLHGEINARASKNDNITLYVNELCELKYSEMETINSELEKSKSSCENLKMKMEKFQENLAKKEEELKSIEKEKADILEKIKILIIQIEDKTEEANELYQRNIENNMDAKKVKLDGLCESVNNIETQRDMLDSKMKSLISDSEDLLKFKNLLDADVNSTKEHLKELILKIKEQYDAGIVKNEQNLAILKAFAEKAEIIESKRLIFREKIDDCAKVTKSGNLDESLAQHTQLSKEVEQFYTENLSDIEKFSKEMIESSLFSNPYTQHTSQTILAGYQQLKNALLVSKNQVENFILIRKSSMLTDQQISEYRKSFNYFDKLKKEFLNLEDFRAFLISLGFNVPVENVSGDAEFERILGMVDVDKTSFITFDNFINFMAVEKKETESADTLIQSFSAITGGQKYITEEQIKENFSEERIKFLLENMEKLEGDEYPAGARNYESFAKSLFSKSS